jgi:shikimate kinase
MSALARKKLVFALIGPKGSGKTHIGFLLEKKCGIKFLNVEKMGIDNIPKSKLTGMELIKEGFHFEELEIDRILSTQDAVAFENTGAHMYFYVVLERLRSKYDVKLVKVFSPLETCYSRIKQRDAGAQIPISDDMVRSINERAAEVDLKWHLTVDNSEMPSDEKIASMFRALLT